jgi:predicted PurR-regulated permease PerM
MAMAKFIYGNKDSIGYKFKSLDIFTKLFIITLLLLALATPFFVYNYQNYNAHGKRQNQEIQDIQNLQKYHSSLANAFDKSPTETDSSPKETISHETTQKFNLMDALQQIIVFIVQIFR